MSVPLLALNDGHRMPQLGLGVWQATPDETAQIVRFAIDDAGYRSIDTAAVYGNEEGVGRALREASVPREDLFVTTKLWNSDHGADRAVAAFDRSLGELGLDYVDLYLIHWPLLNPERLVQTWETLIGIRDSGRARSIGVSNFEPHHVDLIVERTGVVPAVNQVELHPRFQQRAVREYSSARGIAVQAWSPLGGRGGSWDAGPAVNQILDDDVLVAIAAKHGRSTAQVVIRWHLQSGIIVIPKSVDPGRVSENIDVFDFELDDDDLAAIAALDTGARSFRDPDTLNDDARDD